MRVGVVLIFAVLSYAAAEEYLPSPKGMQGLRVKCKNVEEITKVKSFESDDGFDFLRMPRMIGQTIDVLVEANKVKLFKNYLETNDIEYEVFTENFQDLIDQEAFEQNFFLRHAMPKRVFTFRHFPRHAEINDYLRSVYYAYSDLVTLISIGKSYEGRDMLALKISTGGGVKPAVFIDAGIHAREWIAPTTALYIIKELVKPANRYLLDKVDVIVVPTINPDGYEFSHTKYRLWRKTRSRNSQRCFGVDSNRNFDYKWNVAGASNNPCSDIFAGPRAFSEIESRNVRNAILSLNGTVKVYLSLHAYGQMMLHPWGWSKFELPDNEPLLRRVGLMAAEAIYEVRRTEYTVGGSAVILYEAAGGSDDWAMAVGKADLAYTVELPGGYDGFIISPEEIEPVGNETFQAIKVFIAYAAATTH